MEVRRKKLITLFAAVAVLLIAQVAWWAVVFLDDVRVIARLKTEALHLKAEQGGVDVVEEERAIAHSAHRRRVMFLSESSTFAVLSCFGIYLLYRAFLVEGKAREIERNFIEVVTHESKTPLTAMKLRLESAMAKVGDPVAGEIRAALVEVRRLTAIFDKAMTLNRLERNALTFDVVPLAEPVREVIRRLEPWLSARGVNCELKVDEEACVRGDMAALANLVQSLVENAVLYNDKPEKRVSVEVRRSAGRVWLAVADNGPGIAPKDRPLLFERFYRGKHGRGTSGVSGTGLGLYLARTLVEAHQGVIRLEEGRGEGSEFVVELPEVRA